MSEGTQQTGERVLHLRTNREITARSAIVDQHT
jgi:hypothetical protein